MGDYLKSKAIGSSLLGSCIVSSKPLIVCTDRATKEVKPTTFMEMGKIFEDLVKAHYDKGMDWFFEKYFESNFKTFPSGIIEILSQIEIILECPDAATGSDLKSLFYAAHIYNAKPDKDGNKVLNKTYERKHAMLKQIEAHDYRRPIPAPWWEKLEIMLERFGNYKLTLWDTEMSIDQWIKHPSVQALFQVEYFWKTGEAHCRAKFDLIFLIKWNDKTFAIPFDIKCTGDEIAGQKSFGAFVGNWRDKYALQATHYHAGFKEWCEENGYIAYDRMPYIIQESEEPQITHVWCLHPEELQALDEPYHEALPVIQKWIDEGNPIRGQMPQQDVNRYGKTWRIYG